MTEQNSTTRFKICPACKESKPATLEYYLPNTCRPGTLRPKCRPCQKAYSAAYSAAKKAKPNPIPDPANAPLKKCKACGENLAATVINFDTHYMGLHGLDSRCRPCRKTEDTIRRERVDQKERQQRWRDANKAKVKETNEAYRAARYSSTEAVRKWRDENIEEVRLKESAKMRKRRATLPWFNLKTRMSSRIAQMLRGTQKGKARKSTFELVGYTSEQLVAHIESHFEKGMSWDNVLRSEIHIDHRIPVSFFKADDPESLQFKMCWALANLRPVWALENMSKNAKLPDNFSEVWNELYNEVITRGR